MVVTAGTDCAKPCEGGIWAQPKSQRKACDLNIKDEKRAGWFKERLLLVTGDNDF